MIPGTFAAALLTSPGKSEFMINARATEEPDATRILKRNRAQHGKSADGRAGSRSKVVPLVMPTVACRLEPLRRGRMME